MTPRRGLLLAMPALLAGCAPPRIARDGGIGGTGILAQGSDRRGEQEGGIGGTGIFGTVTALGSLEVNGLRLLTDAATTMLPAVEGEVIRPGDVVAAEARRGGAGLVARRVAAFVPLAGPLQAGADGGLAVLGTRLALAEDAPVHRAGGGSVPRAALLPGQHVVVSGVWQGRIVLASSLRLVEPGPEVVLRGQLRRAPDGRPVIGGTILDPGSASLPPEGSFVAARGRPGFGVLAVTAIGAAPLAVFAAPMAGLSVEGVVAPNEDRPGFHLSGFGLPLAEGGTAAPRPGERQLLLGRREGEAFRVEESAPLPPGLDARRAALRRPETGEAIRRWLASA
jgi:hypothetical protein